MIAVLLAAGAGRRLSGCKALLDLGGRTALERCLETLRAAGLAEGRDELRVVLGHQAEEVQAAVDLSSVRVVLNPDPDRGQTSSMRLGLGAGPLPPDGCLLHTVDHPLVRARELRALLGAWEDRAPGVEIVVPSVDGRRGHPVLLGDGPVAELLALADDEPAHAVVRRDTGRIEHVVLDAPWMVRDIDRPEDLEAARAELARRAHGG
jgi:molybdenum cofactor cytidylyltransferase